jgi:hypothetical protein
VRFSAPPLKLDLERLFAGQAFECCDLRLVVLKKISRLGIFAKRPSFELLFSTQNRIRVRETS